MADVSNHRIQEVADAIISIGYEGIIQFDKSEPEYDYLITASKQFKNPSYVALLSILAGTQDYQLAGDAQRFWETLTKTIKRRDELASQRQVNKVISAFMNEPVNARLNSQKKDRLSRLNKNGFGAWFLEGHPEHDPVRVWEKIAAGLETTMDKKTVIFAVKVYDIFNLVVNDAYLELPTEVPIPLDLQVERVAYSSGIVKDRGKESSKDAWANVMRRVNSELEQSVSMLRVDSVVWQAGQIISENSECRRSSQLALIKHFEEVGLGSEKAQYLADEFTLALS